VNLKLPHISLLFKRLLLAYGLYTFCRLVFLATYFKTFSTHPIENILWSLVVGIWFDTTSIMYTFGPIILLHIIPTDARNKNGYQLTTKLFFVLAATIGLTLNFIDVGYFTFSGKRSGFELIKMQGAGNVSPLVYIIDYWYLLLLLLGLIALVWRLYPTLKTTAKTKLVVEIPVMIILGLMTFAGARGSIGLKPLNTLDAAKVAGAELMPLTLNTPFQMLMTIEQSGVEEKNYMAEQEAQNLFNPNHTNTNKSATPGKNVVLIIMESVGKEYVGFYNQNKGYTPFLDSLMQHSEVYTNAYANGKRSIEGIPAIIASMPSWISGDYINSFYQTNTLRSIGYYLSKNGYTTSFFHGGKNGTMSFDRFVANTQAGKYFGLNEYPNKEKDFDGHWGIPDEPYLQYVGKDLTQSKQPFFSTVFTLSSHHPYQLPAAYKNKFKGGPLPIHATVEYMDYAIKNFFDYAKKQTWYSNTLFVFTADHSSENTAAYYQTSHGKYAIPLFVFDATKTEKDSLPILVNKTMDHLGVMLLILDKVTPQKSTYFSFAGNGAIQFEGGVYQLIQHPFVLKFDGTKSIGFYDVQQDSLMQQNLIELKTAPLNEVQRMEQYLKAVIQQYNHKLITNKTH
jgi:phosphoglycerol transferase MdoB-like AlkP superfamily enzyme